MSRITDLTGKKFGRLTVLRTFKGDDGHTWNECVCDCNGINTKLVKSQNLKGGYTNSCGCLRKEQLQRAHEEKKNVNSTTNKYSKHPYNKKLRDVWRIMKHRCCNENYKGYEFYGEKGVKICQEWIDNYDSFFEWSIKNGYSEGLSIDRIDFEKEYSPENCRWTTKEIQANNTSANVWVEYENEKYTITQLSKIFNCSITAIQNRIEDGVYIPTDLFKFVNMMITIEDETMLFYDFSKKYNIEERLMRDRYRKGKRGIDLIKQIDETNSRKVKNKEFGCFKRGDIVEYVSKNNKFIGRIIGFKKDMKTINVKLNNSEIKNVNVNKLTLLERKSE